MTPRATIAGTIVMTCAASLVAQVPPPLGPAQAPEATFRSAVDLAHVDVIVTDAEGHPVSGLTAADFALFENGTPRAITTFEAVDLPIAEAATSSLRAAGEPDVSSNGRPPDRVYMFALDEVAPCNALRTRHFLRQFMDEYFGPNDVAAVALVGTGLATDGQDFTGSRRLLLEAIDKFSGGFDPNCPGRHTPPGTLRSGRSQQLAGLRALTETLARVPARRKAMLLFTQQLDIDMFDVVDYTGGVLGLAGEDAHAILRAATTANIAIYPIDPTGLTPHHIPIATLSSLSALGRATGGFSLSNSNSFAETFEQIVRETSVYYLLGYDSAHDKDNGRYVRVDVEVKRPGLQVRARRGFVAARPREREKTEGLPAVARALASPLAVEDVRLRAAATPRRERGNRAVVDLVVEIDASTLNLIERNGRLTGPLDVRYVVTADRDKSYPEWRYSTTLDLAAADATGGMRLLRVLSQIELPKGRYQLRVAAGSDLTAGSVVHDLEVPDFGSDRLAMSGLALVARPDAALATYRGGAVSGKTRRCRPPRCPDDFLATRTLTAWTIPTFENGPSLPGPLTTRRTFTPGDTVLLYAEIYDNRSGRDAAGAADLEITAALRDADGEIVGVAGESRAREADADRHAFTLRLPLEDVDPGPYVIHLDARSGSDRAHRAIPVEVTPEE